MIGELHRYWVYVGGNIAAIPLELVITAAIGVLLRKPLARLVAWARREEREDAAAARRIVADLYRHHTGREHELAPDEGKVR